MRPKLGHCIPTHRLRVGAVSGEWVGTGVLDLQGEAMSSPHSISSVVTTGSLVSFCVR